MRVLTGPIAEAPHRFRLVLTRDASMSAEAQDSLHALERRVIRTVGEVIEAGMDSGRFRRIDLKVATFTIIGMINWVAWWYVPGRAPTIDELSAGVAAQAVASLRATGADDERSTVLDMVDTIRQDLARLEWLARRE